MVPQRCTSQHAARTGVLPIASKCSWPRVLIWMQELAPGGDLSIWHSQEVAVCGRYFSARALRSPQITRTRTSYEPEARRIQGIRRNLARIASILEAPRPRAVRVLAFWLRGGARPGRPAGGSRLNLPPGRQWLVVSDDDDDGEPEGDADRDGWESVP